MKPFYFYLLAGLSLFVGGSVHTENGDLFFAGLLDYSCGLIFFMEAKMYWEKTVQR